MDKKTFSSILGIVVLALILAGYFNIRPVGPYVRKIFFDAKYKASGAMTAAPAPTGNVALAQQCRDNMRMVESAKAKIRATRAVGAVSWGEVMREMGYSGGMLRCPAGGEYSLGSHQVSIRCSLSDNNSASIADDHILR